MITYNEKEIATLIKDMDYEGRSILFMADYLNKLGYTTKTGKKFNSGTVSFFRLNKCKLPRKMLKGKHKNARNMIKRSKYQEKVELESKQLKLTSPTILEGIKEVDSKRKLAIKMLNNPEFTLDEVVSCLQ